MTAGGFIRWGHRAVDDLFDALADPERSERWMLLVLLGYVVVWTLYAIIAKSSQDIHPDMAEMAAWSERLALGTPKHPPLGSWLLRGWFGVFPRADWAYYLFAMLLPAIALWIAGRISRRYLSPEKCVVGIALLTLVPFYNFFALKFNANAVLTPLWATATWWFLLSFQTRRSGWAVLAGVGAAAAILGKYWSALLVAAFGLAALIDRRSNDYFRSPAPYISLAVATLVLTPHIDWVIAHQFAPLNYAFEAHPASYLTGAESAIGFIGSSVAYIAAPLAFSLIAAQPGLATIADTLWPSEPDRRFAIVLFAAPFLLATLVAILFEVRIEALWAISLMTLLPVVLLSSPMVSISRRAGVISLAIAIAAPLIMLIASPVIAIAVHQAGVDNFQDQYALIARALNEAWQKRTDRPLQIIGSFTSVVNGAAFYIPSRPETFDLYGPALTPWVDDADIRSKGMAMICPESMAPCLQMLDGYGEHYHAVATEHVSLARSYLGSRGPSVPYEIVIIPPR
jgi:4-amino-4-deoxy-L-arabinose transferase-like glycosyltransferase